VRSQASIPLCWLAGIPECSSLKYLLCTVHLVLAMSEVTGKYPGVLMAGIPECSSLKYLLCSVPRVAMSEVSGNYPIVQVARNLACLKGQCHEIFCFWFFKGATKCPHVLLEDIPDLFMLDEYTSVSRPNL
jgi:hypothetical protein